MSSLIEADDIHHGYRSQGDGVWMTVLNGVSFSVQPGECLGIIGESGSGKSTLGRIVLGLEAPKRGQVRLAGQPLYAPSRFWPSRRKRAARVSAVFQDYATSANPFMNVLSIVSEPLLAQRGVSRHEIRRQVIALLRQVGLTDDICARFPHQLSGGQMQRVCIARAIANKPDFIVLDEAVSALDVTVQVQILDLLADLRRRLGLTYLFISHDLMAISYLCQRVIFLRQGRIVERVEDITQLGQVRHPYAQNLLQAVMAL